MAGTPSEIDTPAAQRAMVVDLRSLEPALDDDGVNFGVLHDKGVLPDERPRSKRDAG